MMKPPIRRMRIYNLGCIHVSAMSPSMSTTATCSDEAKRAKPLAKRKTDSNNYYTVCLHAGRRSLAGCHAVG